MQAKSSYNINDLVTETITVSTPDGEMRIYTARPKSPKKDKLPALMVFQEAFGVNAHIKDVCNRLANLGLVAAAPELFHRTGHGADIPYSDFVKVMPMLGRLTNKELLLDAKATYASLIEMPYVDKNRVGSVGYCMGGFVALLAACHLPVRATIAAYGGGLVTVRPNIGFVPFLDSFKEISGATLLIYGEQDKGIPESDRLTVYNKLKDLNKTAELLVYDQAGHGFMCDDRSAFHPESAAKAWVESENWLKKYLGV